MSRALQYYHAALWSNGQWTVEPRESAVSELERLFLSFDMDEDGYGESAN